MWLEPITTFSLIIKGLIVGIIASAPMGPVGVLTVQRTLNKGRWYGFVTGIGAALSDLIYALMTGLGMSIVIDFIQDPENRLYMRVIGSILLFGFGLYTYLSRPAPMRPTSNNKGTLAHNMFTGFLVTFGNPLIVFLFVALFARFDFIQNGHRISQTIGFLSIVAGALLWWFALSTIIDKVRTRFHIETIRRINRVFGLIVIFASVIGLMYALF